MLSLCDVAKEEEKWRKMARYIGVSDQRLDDVIQDLYLKIGEMEQREGSLDRISRDGRVNSLYVFKTIQSIFVDHHRQSRVFERDMEHIVHQVNPETWEKAYEDLMEKLGECIDGMEEYDLFLLELHFVHGYSMRKLSKITEIPLHSIFHRLKTIKGNIKIQINGKFEKYVQEKGEAFPSQGSRRRREEGDEEDGR